ncbi:hypothetical protein A11A3_02772 [Alcanivorax hongdengensis A-11-3]|uniref:Peptidase S54 rhomboid domain-containing protein n=1 Tax=Alcanivorax hongdengensis A-11-3 TaxID=1177179 RepID=L0WHX1_9GAMM|nr:rhomboid family intramembrane serine protease [Alcanivorax hongdengensis]EKF75757.1 hypothetical protein A11A3_02772 [Alcanivorax hongdengensis A-11-3]
MTTTQKRPNAERLKRLPWITALVSLLIILGYLALPAARAPQPVLDWYASSGLKTLEWQNYLAWLRFHGQSPLAASLEQQLATGDHHAYSAALLSPAFDADSRQRGRDFWSPADLERRQSLRDQVPLQLAASPLYQWGLPVQASRPARFFTAPFVPGSPWATFALLLWILPLAIWLEKRLGHGKQLTLWLAGSLLAGAGYLLLARPGQIPLHGAGPALMVWVGAFFGLQRRTLALPIWQPRQRRWQTRHVRPWWLLPLIPAMLSLMLLYSSPANSLAAAILALLGGAAVVQLMRASDSEPQESDPFITPDPQQVSTLSRGWQALALLNGPTARDSFQQVLAGDPAHFSALTGQFTALQLTGDDNGWHQVACALFRHPASGKGEPQQVRHYWHQYQQRSQTPLPGTVGWALVATLARAQAFTEAEALAESLPAAEGRQQALAVLVEEFEKEGLGHRARNWKSQAA